MHLDEEQVQRLLHGELARFAGASAREHLAECAECRTRLTEAERDEVEVWTLLRQVDHPPPQVDARAVLARAVAGNFGWGRWAAGILLVLGLAGVAYAAPGSPLKRWVQDVAQWIGGRSDSLPEAPAPKPPATTPPRLGGIAVAPGRKLVVLFTATRGDGQARVSLTDGAEVVIRAPLGAATFTSEADRLVIDYRGSSDTFEIEIPRGAPRVEIQVNGIRVFLKEGARVTTERSTESGEVYTLPLTSPRP